MTNLTDLKQKYEELGQTIAQMEAQEAETDWPKYGDNYYYVDTDGEVEETTFGAHNSYDFGRKSTGSTFRTEHEAELHKLRLQSMAERWSPEIDAKYWYAGIGGTLNVIYPPLGVYKFASANYWIGNCHKTKADAKAWYEKYGEAWEMGE